MKIKSHKLEKEIASQARSYKEIASAAGISERTLKQARNGARIQPATAGRIAAALGVPIDELISD